MKKIICVLILLCLCLSFSACGKDADKRVSMWNDVVNSVKEKSSDDYYKQIDKLANQGSGFFDDAFFKLYTDSHNPELLLDDLSYLLSEKSRVSESTSAWLNNACSIIIGRIPELTGKDFVSLSTFYRNNTGSYYKDNPDALPLPEETTVREATAINEDTGENIYSTRTNITTVQYYGDFAVASVTKWSFGGGRLGWVNGVFYDEPDRWIKKEYKALYYKGTYLMWDQDSPWSSYKIYPVDIGNRIYLLGNTPGTDEWSLTIEDISRAQSQLLAQREEKEALSQETYTRAMEAFNSEHYQEAYELFESLGDYEQAAEYAENANRLIFETAYSQAETLLSNGNKAQAAFAFYALGDYSDARARCFDVWGQIAQRDTASAGGKHTVAIKTDGTVVAVGDNSSGQCDISTWTDIVAVSAGIFHTVGLKSDGTVVAAGSDNYGQCGVSEWTDIVAISAGEYFTVGLKADGTVVATHYLIGIGQPIKYKGQCDVSDWRDIVAIAAGQDHTVGLKADGTVISTEEKNPSSAPNYGIREVSGWSDIVAIAASEKITIGLKSDGTVVTTCRLGAGRLGSAWNNIIAVAAGPDHIVGLRSDESVIAELLPFGGIDDYGQTAVSGWRNVVAISAGGQHTIGLRSDGTVISTKHNNLFGQNKGQCNVSSWRKIMLPD